MVRSLSKIQEQIAKLQKEADSIQSTVISRIKKEIAQFGLTAEHLFGTTSETGIKSAKQTRAAAGKRQLPKTKGSGKTSKYADGQGNTWGGIGKRPQWIRAALDAGRALEEFLVDAKKPTAKAKAAQAPKPSASPARKKVVARKKPATAAVAAAPKSKAPAKKKTSKAAAPAKKPAAKKVIAKKPRAKAAPVATTESSQAGA